MTDFVGWSALFIRQEGTIAIYDIYDEKDNWAAQCRFDRRRGADVYVLFARENPNGHPLQHVGGRDAWSKWLADHKRAD